MQESDSGQQIIIADRRGGLSADKARQCGAVRSFLAAKSSAEASAPLADVSTAPVVPFFCLFSVSVCAISYFIVCREITLERATTSRRENCFAKSETSLSFRLSSSNAVFVWQAFSKLDICKEIT